MRISDWSSDVCSSDLLHAGPGYGGSCFPKDTLALMKTAQDHDAPLRLIEATIAVNEQRKRAMGRKVIAAMGGEVRGRTVAVLGLTFKPNTDDMRDAPSIDRKSGVEGKSVSVRVDFGGRLIIKKKNQE